MRTITIYTPTYNREHLLPRVYESLCRQTCKNFYWMIIDDGSTDNTRELVQSWIDIGNIEIEYVYKDNGGVHTARDLAYEKVDTELIMGIDSDDWMPDDAVENILDLWKKHGGDKYAGIFAPVSLPNGQHSPGFPKAKALSYQDLTYKYKYKGDKQTILRSDIIKSIPKSPVFEGENLVGEGYKWIQLPDDKPFLLLDKPTLIVDYQDNGYSKTARKSFFLNAQGFRASHCRHITHSKYLLPRIKGHIGYIIYSLYLKDKGIIKNSPKPWGTIFFFPLGVAGYIYARAKWGKHETTK